MRILQLDIETAPNIADVWGLWQQNVSLSQLRESARMLCFAAQWYGEKRVQFWSEWDHGTSEMRAQAWLLLHDADAIMTYNGRRFDLPHINSELVAEGLPPPAPYKQIDLYAEIKRVFRFPSYKLAYVAPALGVGSKVKHEGHELWTKVLLGDLAARKRFQRYCEQDTRLLGPLFDAVHPWIKMPSMGAMTGEDVCPSCGSDQLTKDGFAYTATGRYQRLLCKCGKWSRAARRSDGTAIVAVAP